MDAFTALVHSLGEHAVTYIGKQNLRRLDIFGDERDGTAFMEVFLQENTWEQQTAAIDKINELRDIFFDELSIDFRFMSEDSSTAEAAHARQPSFCLA
jgi:hypothetical protein